RLLQAQEDECVGKLHHVDASDLHCSAAERVDPELLVGFDTGDVEMIVADPHRRVGVTQELCESRRSRAEEQRRQNQNGNLHKSSSLKAPLVEKHPAMRAAADAVAARV